MWRTLQIRARNVATVPQFRNITHDPLMRGRVGPVPDVTEITDG
jgi:hypothetical protein